MKKTIINTILALTIPAALVLSSCSQSNLNTQLITPDNGISALSQPITRVQTSLPRGTRELGASMFSYIVMDDGLSQAGVMFLKALEMGANDKAYYSAFADLQGADNSFVFRIKPSKNENELESDATYLSPTMKEVTSNDPKVMAQAINWAYSSYPGKVKVLDILAHGGGFYGIGTDDFQTGDTKKSIMSVNEFSNGLKNGLKGRKLDIMNMLSCLMGNIEAVYELRDVTSYLIASEDSIRASKDTTFDFTQRLAEMVGQPNINPREVVKTMAISANAKNQNSGYSTIAAIDMNRIKFLKTSVNVLSQEILRAFPAHKAEIISAYDSVPELSVSPRTGQRDLWSFSRGLAKVNDTGLNRAALAVVAELKQTLIHTRDKEGSGANGLSIFMPPRKGQLNMPTDFDIISKVGYSNTRFAKETEWDKVIEVIFNTK
jgi:hypothetical protein